MSERVPHSTLHSQLLIAFTIELDNEFEHQFARAGGGARTASVVMWSNLMRFVGDGIAVRELPAITRTPKARVLSMLGGMERWRYVYVAPKDADGPPKEKRDGYGSGRGLDGDWIVRLTPAGQTAAGIWPPLFDEIECRWEKRFGAEAVGDLSGSLQEIVSAIDADLPEHLPIVASTNGMALDIPQLGKREATSDLHLLALLSQVLITYTLDFERASELSLPLRANVVRVLDEDGVLVRDLPQLAGTSKEAVAMAMTVLRKTGYVEVEGGTAATTRAKLTPSGREVQDDYEDAHAAIEQQWEERFGRDELSRLRISLERLHSDPAQLAEGLEPYPDGWRATTPYLVHTQAMLADPHAGLPHHPLVLPRGGWPDGC